MVQMKKVFPLCPKTMKKHYINTTSLCAILLYGQNYKPVISHTHPIGT